MGNKAGIDMGNRFHLNSALFHAHDVEKHFLCDTPAGVCEIGFAGPTKDDRTVPGLWIQSKSWVQMDEAFRARRAAWSGGSLPKAAAQPETGCAQVADTD